MRPDDRKRALEWAAHEARQIADAAVQIAASVNYDQKGDPAFVAAVMQSITAIYIDATQPPRPPGT